MVEQVVLQSLDSEILAPLIALYLKRALLNITYLSSHLREFHAREGRDGVGVVRLVDLFEPVRNPHEPCGYEVVR